MKISINKKSIFIVLFAMLLSMASASLPVYAGGDMSQWSLEAEGDLVLSNDIILTADVKIDKNITIDLNGHSIINIGKLQRKTEYNGGDTLSHSVFKIDIAHGAQVLIKNGCLYDVPIYNRGDDLRLEYLTICNPHCEGVTNRGEIYKIEYCDIYAQSGAINSSGKTLAIENSRIISDRYEAVQGNFEKIWHCFIMSKDTARGVGLSDGNAGNRIALVDDCLLAGCGRGGLSTWGGVETVRGSTVIGLGDASTSASSRNCAVWMAADKERAKPHITASTLIAKEDGCGYYSSSESGGSAFNECADISSDCSFIKHADMGELEPWLQWEAVSTESWVAKPTFFGAPEISDRLKYSFRNFRDRNECGKDKFTDTEAFAWAQDNIEKAYRTGLMLGKSDSLFDPQDNVSYAEAAALASRLHSIYAQGKDEFAKSEPWFESYLGYAKKNGLIASDMTAFSAEGGASYASAISRADFARLLAAALPESALSPVNSVADNAIPDLSNKDASGRTDERAEPVYLLYRAGILAGSDAKRSFEPASSISRAEAVCIITRMAEPSLRLRFNLR